MTKDKIVKLIVGALVAGAIAAVTYFITNYKKAIDEGQKPAVEQTVPEKGNSIIDGEKK